MFDRTLGTLSLLRDATKTAREAGSRVGVGETGDWQVTLAVSGLSEQRREEIVGALEENLGTPRGPKIGDGRFYFRAVITQASLAVASAHALGEMGRMLREAGVRPQELLSQTELTLEPYAGEPLDLKPVSGRGERVSRALGKISHGLSVAAAEAFEMDARQKLGDRTMYVGGDISGLTPESAEPVVAAARKIFDTVGELEDDTLRMLVTCERVGGALGALLLSVRQLAEVLAEVPASASLMLLVVPAEDVA